MAPNMTHATPDYMASRRVSGCHERHRHRPHIITPADSTGAPSRSPHIPSCQPYVFPFPGRRSAGHTKILARAIITGAIGHIRGRASPNIADLNRHASAATGVPQPLLSAGTAQHRMTYPHATRPSAAHFPGHWLSNPTRPQHPCRNCPMRAPTRSGTTPIAGNLSEGLNRPARTGASCNRCRRGHTATRPTRHITTGFRTPTNVQNIRNNHFVGATVRSVIAPTLDHVVPDRKVPWFAGRRAGRQIASHVRIGPWWR